MNLRHLLPIPILSLAFFSVGCNGTTDPEGELQIMTRKVAAKFTDVPQLSTTDLAAWLADPERKPPQILDAREPAEFNVSHLPGAIRIDPGASADDASANIDPTRPVVIYCSVGYRSSALANRLIKAGHTNIMNLEGSIFKWANEGRPLVQNGQPTHQVHPYNRYYGQMLQPNHRHKP
ncbi:MAG: rhodanese-like domain-containing protein [Luteolibacter sp.]